MGSARQSCDESSERDGRRRPAYSDFPFFTAYRIFDLILSHAPGFLTGAKALNAASTHVHVALEINIEDEGSDRRNQRHARIVACLGRPELIEPAMLLVLRALKHHLDGTAVALESACAAARKVVLGLAHHSQRNS